MATARERNVYKGMSFPFRFGSGGGVATSELTHFDTSRIEESIRQIVLTSKMERVGLPDFGGNLREHIFDIIDDETSMAILQHEMRKAIEENEDRVSVNSLRVYTIDGSEGKIMVEADIHVIKFVKDIPVTFDVTLPTEMIGGNI